MMNSTVINKLSPYLAFFLLFSNTCFCFGQSAPPPQPQAKVIPPPNDSKPKDKADSNECPMEWVLPGGAGYTGELPQTGETPFEWTAHPDAAGYQLVVTQPNGSTIPYKSDAPQKGLYMENYKDAGEYQVELSALDNNGQVICSISLVFTKIAVNSQTGGEGNEPKDGGPIITIPEYDGPY